MGSAADSRIGKPIEQFVNDVLRFDIFPHMTKEAPRPFSRGACCSTSDRLSGLRPRRRPPVVVERQSWLPSVARSLPDIPRQCRADGRRSRLALALRSARGNNTQRTTAYGQERKFDNRAQSGQPERRLTQ
jgi:hypothetical protein